MNDVKNLTPIDLPLFRRLASRGLSLDTGALVGEASPLETAILGSVGLIGRGRPTYLLRTQTGDYAAQIQMEGRRARLTLLAPAPQPDDPDQPWLAILEGILEQAGRRGAYLVTAEVPISSLALELCRRVGFTVYSRQTLFYLENTQPSVVKSGRIHVRPLEENDHGHIHGILANTIPRLVQQADPHHEDDWRGYVITLDGRVRGYFSICEGKQGILVQPYLHPELYDSVTESVRQLLSNYAGRRIFFRLLAHQEWLRQALINDFTFTEGEQYALMVCHTAVYVRETATFSPLAALEGMTLVPGGVEIRSLSPEQLTNKWVKDNEDGLSNNR